MTTPDSDTGRPASSACSVVICAFDDRRMDDLRHAVASVVSQTRAPEAVVVVVDHNHDLLRRVRVALPDIMSIENTREPGAGGARNCGVRSTTTDVVAFLDDDATASPTWLETLLPHHGDSTVIGTGGKIDAAWDQGPPRWFPEEFAWAIGATYRGYPTVCGPVRNVWTGSMTVTRAAFESVGGFRAEAAKVGGRARPEDTDFCLRVARAFPDHHWIFDPAAIVHHRVRRERGRLPYFLRRCFAEGVGKAGLVAAVGAQQGMSTERAYVRDVLPAGVAAGVTAGLRGDIGGAGRAGAIVAGLASAAAGHGIELVRRRIRGCMHQATT